MIIESNKLSVIDMGWHQMSHTPITTPYLLLFPLQT